MVQFGINGDPALSAKWREARIQDDKVAQSNKRGFITYAMAGPEHPHQPGVHQLRRQCQPRRQGFAPFGQVIQGMDVVDKLNAEYGEGAPRGRGPDQGRLQMEGNAYLAKDFRAWISSRRRRSRSNAQQTEQRKADTNGQAGRHA